jgi:alpha-ketoglutarate-dependent taurine dioxygenase
LGSPERFGAKLVDYMETCAEDSRVVRVEYGPDVAPVDINIWHQDHSWHPVPTTFELSYVDLTPEVGGAVLYADAGAAHCSLSPRMQGLLEGLTCVTNLADGYQNLDVRQPSYAQTMLDHPPIEQPVVSSVARDGGDHHGGGEGEPAERCLNVNGPPPFHCCLRLSCAVSFCFLVPPPARVFTWPHLPVHLRTPQVNKAYSVWIPQLHKDESAALLPMLCCHVTKPEHCVRLQYQQGDVIIFDNRKLQHYVSACPLCGVPACISSLPAVCARRPAGREKQLWLVRNAGRVGLLPGCATYLPDELRSS